MKARFGFVICFGLTIGACATDTDAPPASDDPTEATPAVPTEAPPVPELDNRLVLSIDIEPQHTVAYYELEPGIVGLIETFAPGQEIVARDLDLQQAYEKLQPGIAMPPALKAALHRAVERGQVEAQDVTPPSEMRHAEITRSTQRAHDGNWFINSYDGCDITTSYASMLRWSWCVINASGATWAEDGGAKAISGVVIFQTGTGSMILKVGTSTKTKYGVSGMYWDFTGGTGMRMDLVDADGDRWNAIVRMQNSGFNFGWW